MATVLVVDDAAFMRLMLKNILEQAGHTVVCEAVNGIEAVDKYRKFKPDLVTMDITMPDMEGLEAVKKITDYDPEAKVVMCSVIGKRHTIVEAIQSGAKDYIVKPFQQIRLLEAIDKVINGD